MFGEENVRSDHFGARLSFGDTQTVWARTGYLGFLRRTDLTDASGGVCVQSILFVLSQRYMIYCLMSCFTCVCSERHDALYVVGALDEVMELRGMKYHPIDIETSIIRAHRNITEW